MRWPMWTEDLEEDSSGLTPMGLGALALTDLRRYPQGKAGAPLCPLDRSGLEGRGPLPWHGSLHQGA